MQILQKGIIGVVLHAQTSYTIMTYMCLFYFKNECFSGNLHYILSLFENPVIWHSRLSHVGHYHPR